MHLGLYFIVEFYQDNMDNIEECTQTESILCVLGPIANKIIELKNNHKGVECEAHTILYMIKQCESLRLACTHLKEHLLAEAECLGDKMLLKEFHSLYQPFVTSIEGLTTSTKDLHRGGDVGVKDIDEVWDQLIIFAEEILGSLVKILLSWDQAHQRRINRTLDRFLLSVDSLNGVSLSQLAQRFQVVVDDVLAVFSLVEDRVRNIYRVAQRETLFVLLLQLQKTLPFLAVVIMREFRHPGVKACHDFVLSEVRRLVKRLREEMGLGSREYKLQEPAKYITTLNGLFNELTVEPGEYGIGKLPLLGTIKAPVETVVQHSLDVALYGSSEDYSSIMAACDNVLNQLKVLSRIENTEYPDQGYVDVILGVIADALEFLEIRVNSVSVKLVLQSFGYPFASLESLLELSKREEEQTHQGSGSNPEDHLNRLIANFSDEADRFYQIGGLIIACIADPSNVRQLECSMAMLLWLETGLIKAFRSNASNRTKLSLAEILVLSRQWVNEVADFRRLVLSLMEIDNLLQVGKYEIHKIWAEVREDAETGDPASLQEKAERALPYAGCFLTFNEDSLYLSDDQKDDLIKSLMEVKKYSALIGGDDSNIKTRKGLVKRLQYMLTTVSRIAATFSKPTLIQSRSEEDLLGRQDYEEGYTAAMKQLSESDCKNEGVLLSHITDVSRDFSQSSATTVKPNAAPGGASRDDLGSCRSIFKDKSIKIVRRRRHRVQICDDQEYTKEEDAYPKCFSKNDISIDITKFLLSRSTNTLRNSTRASRRNISLKVKEINLDLEDVIKITPKAKAPRYVRPPRRDDQDDSTGLRDTIERMYRVTNSFSTSFNHWYKRKGNWNTLSGHDKTKEFKKKHLFLHTTLLPIIPVHNSLAELLEEPFEASSDCPEVKVLVEKLENVFLSTDHHEKDSTIDTPVSKTSSNLASSGTSSVSSLGDISAISNSHLVSSIATPSSLEINTPERLEDLDEVRKRLSSLKTVFNIDL